MKRSALTAPQGTGSDISAGDRISLQWGGWRIDLEMRDSCADDLTEDQWSRVMPLNEARARISILSLQDAGAIVRGKMAHVPWWERFGRPCILAESENFRDEWIPGESREIKRLLQFSGVQNPCAYVIIAKVLRQTI
jgi:hypothetical protein